MSEQPEQKEKATEQVPVSPEIRIYFDEKSNLKMDFKNANVYMVIGILEATRKRLVSTIGTAKGDPTPVPPQKEPAKA